MSLHNERYKGCHASLVNFCSSVCHHHTLASQCDVLLCKLHYFSMSLNCNEASSVFERCLALVAAGAQKNALECLLQDSVVPIGSCHPA